MSCPRDLKEIKKFILLSQELTLRQQQKARVMKDADTIKAFLECGVEENDEFVEWIEDSYASWGAFANYMMCKKVVDKDDSEYDSDAYTCESETSSDDEVDSGVEPDKDIRGINGEILKKRQRINTDLDDIEKLKRVRHDIRKSETPEERKEALERKNTVLDIMNDRATVGKRKSIKREKLDVKEFK